MLKVRYFPKDGDYGPFLSIETPNCAPVGDDEPLLIDDFNVASKLIADLQSAMTRWQATKTQSEGICK